MNTPETELTENERERLAFIVGAVAAKLSASEQQALAVAVENFARRVASRVYLVAENDGMKKAFGQEERGGGDKQGEQEAG